MCAGLEYGCKPANSFVIKYGEQGDMFYLVLKGTVSVWLPQTPEAMRQPLKQFQNYANFLHSLKPDDFRFTKT